ncbi:unnamed protein product [Amoebophrya sp. A120]|nr:unnamed protein product [Amoebophrya sp. A120]|eukprot:GSA120T00017551001.1
MQRTCGSYRNWYWRAMGSAARARTFLLRREHFARGRQMYLRFIEARRGPSGWQGGCANSGCVARRELRDYECIWVGTKWSACLSIHCRDGGLTPKLRNRNLASRLPAKNFSRDCGHETGARLWCS